MIGTVSQSAFCPDRIFNRLDTYIYQVHILDNIQVANSRRISSRTLGSIFLSEEIGQKKIEIVKDDLTLYSANKVDDWIVIENHLDSQQISAIENLPQTREEIFIEFYGRKLTETLKNTFQLKNYPINHTISLNHAQIPYDFIITDKSTNNKIFFVGTDIDGNVVFEASFLSDGQIEVVKNNLSLEHISQLSCF